MDSRPIVAVARVLPEAGMDLLHAAEAAGEITLRVWPGDLPPNAGELAELVRGAAGLVSLVTDPITGALLDREPQLKVVSQFAVGYDNIDVRACTDRRIAVCNTPGVLTETTADFAFSLLCSAARRVVEGVDYVRAGKWKTWGPTLLLGRDLTGATIGIVGFGRIGKEMARRATGFDMRILAFDTHHDTDAAKNLGVSFVDLETLLRESDFISLHCALTPETRHLIGAREFELMKPSAILVNAARGPVVDTDALVDALRSERIFSAALDVTDPEPLPADHPLIGMSNCIVVPHIASATVDTRNKMATMAVNNLLAVIRGERPAHCVNPEVLAR